MATPGWRWPRSATRRRVPMACCPWRRIRSWVATSTRLIPAMPGCASFCRALPARRRNISSASAVSRRSIRRPRRPRTRRHSSPTITSIRGPPAGSMNSASGSSSAIRSPVRQSSMPTSVTPRSASMSMDSRGIHSWWALRATQSMGVMSPSAPRSPPASCSSRIKTASASLAVWREVVMCTGIRSRSTMPLSRRSPASTAAARRGPRSSTSTTAPVSGAITRCRSMTPAES